MEVQGVRWTSEGDLGMEPLRGVKQETEQSGLLLRAATWAAKWKMGWGVRGGKSPAKTSFMSTCCKNLFSVRVTLWDK